uniref:BTB domain-containing protein n=1 Tax=Panagrolaimus sp. ES5 TaxID=591445 RepID=A0AC34FPA1_9BILA
MECQIATDWIVDEKALLEIKENDCLESQHIQTTIPGVGYYIQIHPNDKIENDDNVVYFHIYVDRPQFIDCDLDYTFSIPSAKFCETYDDDVNVVYACKRVAFFEPKNKYFQNGKITLQLRGTLKGDPMEVIEHDTFTQMLWYKDDKDFTIQIDDKEIKVHKLILRHCSPVFAAMFDSGMKEAQENKVKIEGFPFIAVRMAMEFCYDIKILLN